ncbi:MAG: hypothetical protein LBF26_03770 [Puniceicoccales bacterium]|jgi:DNA-binding NarL/FixJ family response regulator|nr:hypothetical protein [Puniceicoccales bacterium]
MHAKFLTAEERKDLRKMHHGEKNRRVADRIKPVLMADAGWSYRDIAEALLLDDETISCHVREYRSGKKLTLDV